MEQRDTSVEKRAVPIEKDMKSLEDIEEKILQVIQIASEVTKEMGNPDNPTPECVERTKELTKGYLKTVDEICDSLIEQSDLIVNYRESYRNGALDTLRKTIDVMESTAVTPNKIINLDTVRK